MFLRQLKETGNDLINLVLVITTEILQELGETLFKPAHYFLHSAILLLFLETFEAFKSPIEGFVFFIPC